MFFMSWRRAAICRQTSGRLMHPEQLRFLRALYFDLHAITQGVADEVCAPACRIPSSCANLVWSWCLFGPLLEAQILDGTRSRDQFGLVIAAEARGPDQRSSTVASLLKRYDEARAAAADKRLMEQEAGYSRDERISSGYRAALFFVALEDLCGHDKLRAAFQEIVFRARAGDEVGYEELRAALESESGRDLAEMFRSWLIRPGVPDDFRARYASSPYTPAGNR